MSSSGIFSQTELEIQQRKTNDTNTNIITNQEILETDNYEQIISNDEQQQTPRISSFILQNPHNLSSNNNSQVPTPRLSNRDTRDTPYKKIQPFSEIDSINNHFKGIPIASQNQTPRQTQRDTQDIHFKGIFDEIKQFHKKYNSIDFKKKSNSNGNIQTNFDKDNKVFNQQSRQKLNGKTNSLQIGLQQLQQSQQQQQQQKKGVLNKRLVRSQTSYSKGQYQHRRFKSNISNESDFSQNLQEQKKMLEFQENEIVRLQTIIQQQKLKLFKKQQQGEEYKRDLSKIISNMQKHIKSVQQSKEKAKSNLIIDLFKQLSKTQCDLKPNQEKEGLFNFLVQNQDTFQLKIRSEEVPQFNDFAYNMNMPTASDHDIQSNNNSDFNASPTNFCSGMKSVRSQQSVFRFTPRFVNSIVDLEGQDQITNNNSNNQNINHNHNSQQKQTKFSQFFYQNDIIESDNCLLVDDKEVLLEELITLMSQESEIPLGNNNYHNFNHQSSNLPSNLPSHREQMQNYRDKQQSSYHSKYSELDSQLENTMEYEKQIKKVLSSYKQQQYQKERNSQIAISSETQTQTKQQQQGKEKIRSCQCQIF